MKERKNERKEKKSKSNNKRNRKKLNEKTVVHEKTNFTGQVDVDCRVDIYL